MNLENVLLRLLEKLESIGQHHGELYDSEVRERMGTAIMEGFVRGRNEYRIADDLGMFSEEANHAVRSSIQGYLDEANSEAATLGMTKFHDRLAAFQNDVVRTKKDKNDFDEFFGTTPPEFYNEFGVVIRLQ